MNNGFTNLDRLTTHDSTQCTGSEVNLLKFFPRRGPRGIRNPNKSSPDPVYPPPPQHEEGKGKERVSREKSSEKKENGEGTESMRGSQHPEEP